MTRFESSQVKSNTRCCYLSELNPVDATANCQSSAETLYFYLNSSIECTLTFTLIHSLTHSQRRKKLICRNCSNQRPRWTELFPRRTREFIYMKRNKTVGGERVVHCCTLFCSHTTKESRLTILSISNESVHDSVPTMVRGSRNRMRGKRMNDTSS